MGPTPDGIDMKPGDLHHELNTLRTSLLRLAAMVEGRVVQLVQALDEIDSSLAEQIRDGDREIDEVEVSLENECMRLLALYQPVARDLRFIVSVLRINADLERIADEAKGVAKRLLDFATLPRPDSPPALRRMAVESRDLFIDALNAFSRQDAEASRVICRRDEQIDRYQKEIFQWAQSALASNDTGAVIDLLSITRKLERIADHCTNIAEATIFLVEGEVVRHKAV